MKDGKTFSGRQAGRFGLFLLLSLITLIFLLPILWMVSSSVTPNETVFKYPPQWVPAHATLKNYTEVFTSGRTVRISMALWNSSLVAAVTVLVTIGIASLAAYPLARMDFWGKNSLFILILAGLMIPWEVTFVSLFLLFHKLRWINTYQALILPSLASPFGVFLLRQFFLSIPKDLEDAARMDGCGRLRILVLIILPLSKPALATLTIFIFLMSWNNFLWPLIVMTEPNMMTVPVVLAFYAATFQSTMEWGTLMATAFLSSFLPVILFLLLQKHFVRGITLSGLKG
jgi:ABC-type glycerol-3-phosphate transport system permease component